MRSVGRNLYIDASTVLLSQQDAANGIDGGQQSAWGVFTLRPYQDRLQLEWGLVSLFTVNDHLPVNETKIRITPALDVLGVLPPGEGAVG